MKRGTLMTTLIVGFLVSSDGVACGQSAEVSHGYAQVGGGELYYEEAGAGQAIVLIHGGAMDRRMWDDQFQLFAADHRVVRYDLPGFGNSPRREEPYAASEELRELMILLEIDRAHVVGLSFGGGIAIDFALAYPETTSALIVAEPGVAGYQFSPEIMEVMREVFQAAARGDREEAVEAFMAGPAFEQVRDNPAAYAKIETLVRENLFGMTTQLGLRFQEPRAIERLARIDMPTLVLTSEHAGLDAQRIGARIVADVANVTRVQIPDSGHMMNIEQPEAFNSALLSFVEELEDNR